MKSNQKVIMMFETKGNGYLHVMLETKGLRLRRLTLLEAGMWVLDLICCLGALRFERGETSVVFLWLDLKTKKSRFVFVCFSI